MRVTPFKQISTDSEQLDRVQANIEAALKPLVGQPILNNVILQDIELVSGSENTINHGLSRELIGWILIKQDAGALIWDSQDDNTTTNKTLILNASADVKVSILVF